MLPLSNETLQILSLKHPEAQQAHSLLISGFKPLET